MFFLSFRTFLSGNKTFACHFSGILPESPYMYQLLGLNLMSLLAQNRLGEFHTVSVKALTSIVFSVQSF